jgi:hypothetical protein
MRSLAVLVIALALLAVTGCGESDEEKAQAQVCDARADISKEVDQLKGLTLATASVDGVRQSLDTIQSSLKRIADAQATLSDDRRAEVKAATDRFKSSVTSIAQGVRGDLSLSEAATRLRAAGGELATAYRQSLGRIDCGSS